MPKTTKPNAKRKYEEFIKDTKIIESEYESLSDCESKSSSNLKPNPKFNSKSNEEKSSSITLSSEESEKLYEVEAIVGRKNRNGKNLYLVKWVGYPSDQNTWEPVKNLTNVTDMIEEYEKENISKRGRKKSKKQPDLINEENLEDIIEKYKDYGLNAIIGNKIGNNNNKSRDLTGSTDENEEKSVNISHNSISVIDNNCNNILQITGDICEKLKKNDMMGDIKKDRPLIIKFAKISNSKMQFLVKWKKRENGLEPFESFVPHDVIKKLYPYVLLDFYESKLRCVNVDYVENKQILN